MPSDEANKPKAAKKDAPSIKETFEILIKDRLLQVLIVANILCLFIYAQMDSSLIQYLTRAQVPELLELISTMIFVNALVIISCQFILLKLFAQRPLLTRIKFGLTLLITALVWFALNPLDFFAGWIGAVVVISLAEAILFPTMNVHIDQIAPKNHRGAYFGATSLYDLGYALAPIGGGLILDLYGGRWLFLGCAALWVSRHGALLIY